MKQTANQLLQVVVKSLLLVLTAAMREGPRADYLIEAVIIAGPILVVVVRAPTLADVCAPVIVEPVGGPIVGDLAVMDHVTRGVELCQNA